MKRILGVYLSNNGAMKDFVASYKTMDPAVDNWLDQTGSKLSLFTLIKTASKYSEIRFLNGEYRPKLLIFCLLIRACRLLRIDSCHITVTWHDVTPHHMKAFDIALWTFSFLSSVVSDKTIVHNSKFIDAWPLQLFNTKIMFRPLPLLQDIEPKAISVPQGLCLSDCVVFFGRIEDYKGLNELIDIYKFYSDDELKHLLIVGKLSSQMIDKISDDTRIFNIPEYLSESELGFILKSSSAIVMPYKHFSQSNHPYWAAMFNCSLYASATVRSGLSDIVLDGCYEMQFNKNASYLDKAIITKGLELDVQKIKAFYE